MRMSFEGVSFGLAVVLSVAAVVATGAIVGCGPSHEGAPRSAPLEVEAEEEASPTEDGPLDVPTGAFASIEALCAEQKRTILPRIEEANASNQEMGMAPEYAIAPSCEVDHEALAKAKVVLAPPVSELVAIRVETGRATAFYAVVRTSEGWRAVSSPLGQWFHNDPGCPAILRDNGATAIRVEDGTLVIIDGVSRGAGDEVDATNADGEPQVFLWEETTERARACRFGSRRAIRCDDPVTFHRSKSVDKGPKAGSPVELFSTTFRLDESGHVVAAEEDHADD